MKKNVWRKDRNFFFFFFLEWRASDEKFRSDKCKNGGGEGGEGEQKKKAYKLDLLSFCRGSTKRTSMPYWIPSTPSI